jgi:hypothetical protein
MPSTKDQNKTYYARHRERVLAYQRERYHLMTPDQWEAYREYQRERYRKKHPLPAAKPAAPAPARTPHGPTIKAIAEGVIPSFA